jgi:hypothetical protein
VNDLASSSFCQASSVDQKDVERAAPDLKSPPELVEKATASWAGALRMVLRDEGEGGGVWGREKRSGHQNSAEAPLPEVPRGATHSPPEDPPKKDIRTAEGRACGRGKMWLAFEAF